MEREGTGRYDQKTKTIDDKNGVMENGNGVIRIWTFNNSLKY